MGFVPTGFSRLDHAHAGLEFCLRDLGRAMQERDLVAARGWTCLLVQKLAEHFSEEERLMQLYDWSQRATHFKAHERILVTFSSFGRRLDVARHVDLDLSQMAHLHLPEILRIHDIMTDFGFAMFAMGMERLGPSAAFRRRGGTKAPTARPFPEGKASNISPHWLRKMSEGVPGN